MQRISLGLAYAGQAFDGWQTQPHGRTVQDQLEKALSLLTVNAKNSKNPSTIRVVCAGRTDAGVHAQGQVVHFDTPVCRSLQAWVRATNAYLPSTIAVQWAHIVPSSFHARFSAQWREYEYRIYCAQQRHPLMYSATWCLYGLDIEAMRQAIMPLKGVHDFSAFRAAQCQAVTPVRHLMAFDIAQQGNVLVFTIRANAFLQHMVRNLIGSLVEVGLRRKSVEWLKDVLDSKNRSLAGRTYPAQGLTLVRVGYDAQLGLPVG